MTFSWGSHNSLMTFSWLSLDFLLTFSLVSQDFLMTFSWFSHEFLTTFLWLSHDFILTFYDFLVPFRDFLFTFLWLSHDLFMTFSWLSHNFLINFSWLSHHFSWTSELAMVCALLALVAIIFPIFWLRSRPYINSFHRIGPLGRFDLVVTMSVCVSVCLCVCLMSLFMWYILRPIWPPLPEVGCQKKFRDSESLGKSAGKKWYQNWTFLLGWGLKSPRKKSCFCWFCPTKHGGNHASRWIRDLWLKGISLILAYL